MSNRSYNQLCGIAHALNIVGERWTLLIVRELIGGPRRYKDLVDGLPGISTNLLAERLKQLEQQGILRRRVLPPPAGSTVYELTTLGQGLEPALIELGKWGSRWVPPKDSGTVLRLGSYALLPKTFFRPERARGVDDTFELHIGDEVQQIHIHDGAIQVVPGAPRAANVIVEADMPSYLALLGGQLSPEEAASNGSMRITGDLAALRRFVAICGVADTDAVSNAAE